MNGYRCNPLLSDYDLTSTTDMSHDKNQIRLLAKALYEIRLLLGDHLGSDCTAALPILEAAHLSYALHNEALAVLEGRDFDLNQAMSKIQSINGVIPGSGIASRVLKYE